MSQQLFLGAGSRPLTFSCHFPSQTPQPHNVTDTFVEIIGTAVDASTIKFMACINMGPKLGAFYLCTILPPTPDVIGWQTWP